MSIAYLLFHVCTLKHQLTIAHHLFHVPTLKHQLTIAHLLFHVSASKHQLTIAYLLFHVRTLKHQLTIAYFLFHVPTLKHQLTIAYLLFHVPMKLEQVQLQGLTPAHHLRRVITVRQTFRRWAVEHLGKQLVMELNGILGAKKDDHLALFALHLFNQMEMPFTTRVCRLKKHKTVLILLCKPISMRTCKTKQKCNFN